MANLEQWVSDSLHDILGLSDRYVAQFMIGSARKSSSAQGFVAHLKSTGTIDINQRVIAFAQELYEKIPRKQVVEKPARAIERHVMEIERKNRNYTLLSDSESDGEAVREREKEKKKSKDRGDKRKHLRKREESQSSSEEETPKSKLGHGNQKSSKNDEEEEEEWEKEERERVLDLEERDAFAERMKLKDKDKTRNIMERTDKKGYEEAQKRLKMAEEDHKKIVSTLLKCPVAIVI
ncbi:pre-mRNA-splicing factor ATP-dependent RNA helicase DHX16-like isoform X2 [Salvelinus sp. IW2-2015]|uniref:pre-mRNA-splicing factor ATP-dependent RNA helicase DHX16-like isoform X2 n=1 Tax=Salvelinus sp. IW2-2015 TaxID=2691554 RepID=UPI0038D3EAA4